MNFKPLGATLHLDARMPGAAFADSDPVGTWTDRAGTNNATQVTAGIRPEYKTNIRAGNPAMYFSATKGMTTACGLPIPYSIFFCGNTVSGTGGNRNVQSVDQNRVICFNRASAGVYNGAVVTSDLSVNPGTNFAFGVLEVGSVSRWRVNAVDRTGNTSALNNWGTLSLNVTGSTYEGSISNQLAVVGIPAVLSPSSRKRIEQSLALTWKIPC